MARTVGPRALVMQLVGLTACMAAAAEITWTTDLATALRQAASSKKPVLLYFTTQWCGWCKKLDAETYTNKTVVQFISEHFLPVKLDGDKSKELVRRYQVNGYPTVVVVNGKGQVVKHIAGFRPPDSFLTELWDAVELAALMEEIPSLEEQARGEGTKASQAAARLGYIYRRLGNDKMALTYLGRARDAGLESPDLELDLALATRTGAQLITALQKWSTAHPEHPRRWEALYHLGLAQAEMRLWKDAVATFDKVAAEAPQTVWGSLSGMYARLIRERFLRSEGTDSCST